MNATEQRRFTWRRAVKRGVSLKLQEEERERRMEVAQGRSELSEADTNHITVYPDTMSMSKELGMNSSPNITTHPAQTRCGAAVRKILECSTSGVDLHSEYQIVTERSRSS